MAEKKNEPVVKVRDGALSVSVFANEIKTKAGEKMTVFNGQLQRRYKDGEEWKSTNSIPHSDFSKAAQLLNAAYMETLKVKQDSKE